MCPHLCYPSVCLFKIHQQVRPSPVTAVVTMKEEMREQQSKQAASAEERGSR